MMLIYDTAFAVFVHFLPTRAPSAYYNGFQAPYSFFESGHFFRRKYAMYLMRAFDMTASLIRKTTNAQSHYKIDSDFFYFRICPHSVVCAVHSLAKINLYAKNF